ncbi:integral membrane protein [Ophiostoma piceae UAMH 11346]|uniref:Integral membrane protein n=1 Tax=Ophiostoma piceae (strain UAMH 11346) TaxID=1262450 RepID=S3CWW3_OPHP1|nr:integral membrane protein [Ophiostoma piceae UAMH 11346]
MAIDAKSKQATLAHMNKDHSSDIGLYLRFVNGMSTEQLAAEGLPQMVDMDLSSITIRTGTTGHVHTVALDPPMASWGERRQRLIGLAIDARKAFGVPLPEHGPPSDGNAAKKPIPFSPPAGSDIAVFGSVVFFAVMAVLVRTGHDATPTSVWTAALAKVGVTDKNFYFGGAEGFRKLVVWLIAPVLAIHVTEVWWLDRTRLAPRGMARFSRDWCLWMGSTFWEGIAGYNRFDRLAREADGKQH